MKNYVTNYVEWEQALIMLFQGYYISPPMEAVHMIRMIKFGGKKPLVQNLVQKPLIQDTKTTFPDLPSQPGVYKRLMLAATIQKRIVIGIEYESGSLTKRLEFFSLEKDEWIRISRNVPEENQVATYDVSNDSKMIYSQIGESHIILFHIENRKDNNFIQLLHFHKNEVTDFSNGTLTYSSYCFDVPEEITSLRNFCLIEKTKSEFLVVGAFHQLYFDPEDKEEEVEDEEHEEGKGAEKDEDEKKVEKDEEEEGKYDVDDDGLIFRRSYKEIVWSGCLSQDKTKIIWKDTGHKIPLIGSYHRCFCVGENIYLTYYNEGGEYCHINSHNYDRYDWEEKRYYRNVFSPSSLLNEHIGLSGNIDENKELVVVAARMNHLMKRMGQHVSVWLPFNRLYSKRQPLVFTRYEGGCRCIAKRCKFCGCRHFGEQCNNEIGSEANNIFFLPILK